MNKSPDKGNQKAWEDYWTDGRASGSIGCLPDSTGSLDDVQKQYWHATLNQLPKKGTVVDLATGDGAVLSLIHTFRRDLKLIGVDYSATLPAIKKPIKLRPKVNMEDLPFADRSIDAIISRFGIEYGNIPKIAREIVKVLKPGGIFAFILHHKDSPIHATNNSRLEQLDWALNDQEITKRAVGYLNARHQLGNVIPPGFSSAVSSAVSIYGPSSVAAEFTRAVLETLQLGLGNPRAICIDIINQLQHHSNSEMLRINAMITASQNEQDIGNFVQKLVQSGLQSDAPSLLMVKGQSAPIAWTLNGHKPSSGAEHF